MSNNIGIQAGTFDPVHIGHLHVMSEARKKLDLCLVVLIPARYPRTKDTRQISTLRHRLEMLKLAVGREQDVRIYPSQGYGWEILYAYQSIVAKEGDLYYVTGCDTISRLREWDAPDRLIELCRIVVVPRPGCEPPDLQEMEAGVPGIRNNVIFLNIEPIDISSTKIRQRVAEGLSIQDMVPPKVESYIYRHKLYLNEPVTVGGREGESVD